MANPSPQTLTIDTWTKVAADVPSVKVWFIDSGAHYYYTFRDKDETSPVGDPRVDAVAFSQSAHLSHNVVEYQFTDTTGDVWVYSTGVDARITVEVSAFGGGGLINSTIDTLLDAVQITNVSPLSGEWVASQLASETSAAAATYEYYIAMNGYKGHALQLITAATSGITMTVEGAIAAAGTAASAASYKDITSSLYGVASLTAADILADGEGAAGAFTFLKVKMVIASGTPDFVIMESRLY